VPEPTATAAVFLSYAREDTAAARRIADALRAFGVEVWFDQSELRGGDAWDGKIKKQIRECTLFVPLVSAQTQARSEGYFRREWLLAVERTRDMAHGVAFIVPVVIDETREAAAAVPEEFMRFHWTRLAHGVPSPQFVEQVKHLLESQRKASPGARPLAAAPSAAPEVGRALRTRLNWTGWAAAVILIGASGWMLLQRSSDAVPPPAAAAQRSAPPTAGKFTPPLGDKSIAVLPFANMSAEKENEFFADGVHEDVITTLAKIRDLTVISRTSVLAYRDTASRNLRKIAADLGVATVLEGSVRRAGNRVKVTAQLIDARTDAHLWADNYEGDLTDIFALQARLAQEIAGALKATLTTSERALIERRPTQNPAAYERYLRGLVLEENLSTRSNRDRFEQAIALYEQAVALDPGFALAYARLTRLHGAMFFLASLDPTPARRARAQATVEAAQRFAPNAPETREARGSFIYFCENDWGRALAELHAAEASLPNDALLISQIAFAHRRLGQMPESIRYLERASAINPHDLYTGGVLTQTLFMMRQFEPALVAARRYMDRFPNDNYMREYAIRAQFALDGDRAAYVRLRTALPPQDNDPQGGRAAYENALLAGDYTAAARALADPRLTTLAQPSATIGDPVALHRALVAFLRGDREAAQQFADEALAFYGERSWLPRQEPFVRLGRAQAAAFSGRTADAVREVQAAVEQVTGRDEFSEAVARLEVARIYTALGQREPALAALRELMKGMTVFSPNEMRHDPLLSRLKDDPRFEEILRAAKPL
jgi:TolB-like protein